MSLPPPSNASTSSSQEIHYPLFHDSSTDAAPTSIIHPSTHPNTNPTATTTTAITNFHHQPLELFNYSWPTTTNPITTQVPPTTSSPTSFLTSNTLDNTENSQPKGMTSKTDLSPSPIAPPHVPSSSSSSSQSSSSSPSSHQKPHPLFDPSNPIENKMINILPLSTNDDFSNQLSSNIHSNHQTSNNNPPPSFYTMDNSYGSRPSTAPSASFWSNPNNSTTTTIIKAPTPTTNTSTSNTLSSTNLADLSFDDALKSFPYHPHPTLPPSSIPNLNQLIAPSQPHQPPPSMMMNPSQDLMTRNELVSAPRYHDLISSPHSPSAGLVSHHPLHPHHHPIYQHPYNPLNSNSSPIDHQPFPMATHHTHPHPNGWHTGFDPAHLATCYDPFQIKHRRRTTPSQLSVLEAQFQTNCKPDVSLRKQLADQLDMTPREVQVWFQNRRAKTKKLERRAEQESGKPAEPDPIPNASRPTTSPPASIYLSSPSLRGLALPVTHESPEDVRTGVSPPRFVTGAVKTVSEVDEGEQETQHRLESDRRHRSRSLHHHPYYLPSLNTCNLATAPNVSNSLVGANVLHQQPSFGDGGDDASITGRRSSHASNASSAVTATDSNLLCTPTTTEFGSEHTMELPDGYDPRRRSSCPAEFIQSFGHFGLAINQSLDHHSQAGLQSSFMATSQAPESLQKPIVHANATPFTMLLDQNQEWIQHGYRNDAVREGIQRRHSLATMNSPTEAQENSHGEISNTEYNATTGFSSLFSMGTARYPTPVSSGIDNNHFNALKTNNATRGGYVRRASTSVLKSIEEHPGNA